MGTRVGHCYGVFRTMAAKLDTPLGTARTWIDGIDLIPPRINAPGSGCPDYDRAVAVLFALNPAGMKLPCQRRPVRCFSIVPEWHETVWEAACRLRGAS